jgi:hypothetical protein
MHIVQARLDGWPILCYTSYMNTVHTSTATAGEWKAANVYPTVDALAKELGPSRQVVCRELRAGTIPSIR